MSGKKKPCREAWKTCEHCLESGDLILIVDLSCPAGGWVGGRRVAIKDGCGAACLHYIHADARRSPERRFNASGVELLG